jgi:hypothetical protein
VEQHAEFETKIEDDPIALLKAIKVLMHGGIQAQSPFMSMTEALQRFLNLRQFEGDQLLDYVKKFKEARDVMVPYLGEEFLYKFVEKTQEYKDLQDTTATLNLQKESMKQWAGMLVVMNSD